MNSALILNEIFTRPLTVTRIARELKVSHPRVSRMREPGGMLLRFAAFFDALVAVAPDSAAVFLEWLRSRLRPAFTGTWSPVVVVQAAGEVIKAEFERRPMRMMLDVYSELVRVAVWRRDILAEMVRLDDEGRAMAGGAA